MSDTYNVVFELQARYFKDFLNTAFQVKDEACLHIEADRWRILETDPANVVAVNSVLEKDAFSTYDEDIDSLDVGLNLLTLTDILKIADSDEYILFRVEYNISDDETKNAEKIRLSFSGFKYSLRPIGDFMFRSDFQPPALDPQGTVIFYKKDFNILLNAPYKIGAKYIYFILNEDDFKGLSKSEGEGSSMEYTVEKNRLIGHAFKSDEKELKSLYSLEYLEKIRKSFSNSKSNEIKLEFGNNYPLRATFEYAEDYGESVFYLAPRIEEEYI